MLFAFSSYSIYTANKKSTEKFRGQAKSRRTVFTPANPRTAKRFYCGRVSLLCCVARAQECADGCDRSTAIILRLLRGRFWLILWWMAIEKFLDCTANQPINAAL